MNSAGTRSALVPVLLCALGLLYLLGIEEHDLWTPDEPRVASVGRQVAEGAWVVPTLNGKPFLEQPPLHAWCVALLYKVIGFDPALRARWISVAFGLAGLAVIHGLATFLASRRVGLLTALTLGLSFEYFSTAHRVVVDGALAFFTLLSVYSCLRGITADALAARLGWLALGYASASAAFLTKGPVGIAVPALSVIAWAIATRDLKVFARAHLWLAPVAFAVTAGPWLWALFEQTGWEGFKTLLGDNLVGRVLPPAEEGTRSHLRGPLFYFAALPVNLLPATAFVVGGAIDRIRRRKILDPVERRLYDFGFVWLALGFTMFTAASTKRYIYLLPILPAAALPGGLWLDLYLSGKADGAYEKCFGHILSIAILLFALALAVSGALLEGVSTPLAVSGAVIPGVIALWMLRQARSGRRSALLTVWLAGFTVAVLAASYTLVPAFDAIKSLTGVTRRVAALVPTERPICALGADETTRGMFPLYTGRPLRMLDDAQGLEAELRQSGEVYLLVTEKRGRRHRAMDLLDSHPSKLLHEDIRKGSRAFRLYRLYSSRP